MFRSVGRSLYRRHRDRGPRSGPTVGRTPGAVHQVDSEAVKFHNRSRVVDPVQHIPLAIEIPLGFIWRAC